MKFLQITLSLAFTLGTISCIVAGADVKIEDKLERFTTEIKQTREDLKSFTKDLDNIEDEKRLQDRKVESYLSGPVNNENSYYRAEYYGDLDTKRNWITKVTTVLNDIIDVEKEEARIRKLLDEKLSLVNGDCGFEGNWINTIIIPLKHERQILGDKFGSLRKQGFVSQSKEIKKNREEITVVSKAIENANGVKNAFMSFAHIIPVMKDRKMTMIRSPSHIQMREKKSKERECKRQKLQATVDRIRESANKEEAKTKKRSSRRKRKRNRKREEKA
jgi:hypothetical protein